jgi:acetyl esterase/lipase
MPTTPARFCRKAPISACLLICATFPAFAAKPEVLKDMVYVQRNGTPLTLDAYLVPDKKVHPAVINIHGGGFVTGDKSHISTGFREIRDLILANGISVISANYRLAPQHPYPAAGLPRWCQISTREQGSYGNLVLWRTRLFVTGD